MTTEDWIGIGISLGLFIIVCLVCYGANWYGRRGAHKVLVATGEAQRLIDLTKSCLESFYAQEKIYQNKLKAMGIPETDKLQYEITLERIQKDIKEGNKDIDVWQGWIDKYDGKYTVECCDRPVRIK